jgi:hypothetical protein
LELWRRLTARFHGAIKPMPQRNSAGLESDG